MTDSKNKPGNKQTNDAVESAKDNSATDKSRSDKSAERDQSVKTGKSDGGAIAKTPPQRTQKQSAQKPPVQKTAQSTADDSRLELKPQHKASAESTTTNVQNRVQKTADTAKTNKNAELTSQSKAELAASSNKKPTTDSQTMPNDTPAATHASNNSNQQPAKSSGKGLSLFAILLSLCALAGTGFTWYQNQVVQVQEESKLSVGVSEIGGQVARLGDSIANIKQQQSNVVTQSELETKVLGLQSSVESQVNAIKGDQKELGDSLNKINSDLQTGVNQYLIEEVSQLLRLANNAVLFGDDAESAINALGLADNQLKSLSDPRYSVVRRTINKEITLLRNTKQVDVEALSATLNTISKAIPDLPLANEPPVVNSSNAAPTAPADANVTWRTELRKIWNDMLSSVQVQRVDQPPKPLLVPQQRYFLTQNLQLSVAKAELALLQNQPKVYKRSLNDSVVWLRDYFDLSDKSVNSVVKQLSELESAPLRNNLPSITGSYQALQNIKGGQ